MEPPEEEKPVGSIQSVGKERVDVDEDGYRAVRRPRPRTLGQYMPEIFAVDGENQEIASQRSCQIRGFAEIVVRRSCATSGALKKRSEHRGRD